MVSFTDNLGGRYRIILYCRGATQGRLLLELEPFADLFCLSALHVRNAHAYISLEEIFLKI